MKSQLQKLSHPTLYMQQVQTPVEVLGGLSDIKRWLLNMPPLETIEDWNEVLEWLHIGQDCRYIESLEKLLSPNDWASFPPRRMRELSPVQQKQIREIQVNYA